MLRFPTGQYQATPWNHAANEGISEWPPCQWRLLRALIATWHTRCPSIPEEDLDQLLTALASEPPAYLLPEAKPSHTRHYLPNPKHRSDLSGETTLQFAPRLNLDPRVSVRVLWPHVDLSQTAQETLRSLLEQLPYVGRAESRCDATLVLGSQCSLPDDTWMVPAPDGPHEVLAATSDVTRSQLEVSPDRMRHSRSRMPQGARWVRYSDPVEQSRPIPHPQRKMPTTVRWLLHTPAPFLSADGILATHGLRGAVLGPQETHQKIHQEVSDSWLIAGPHPVDQRISDHRHAHWIWLVNDGQVSELVLWVPEGIPQELLPRVVNARRLPRFAYAPKGYRGGAEVHLQAMGSADMVVPSLVSATATRWSSVIPMLTDRHPKRNRNRQEFAQREVERELVFRWGKKAPSVQVELVADWDSAEVNLYRRYRWTETMAQRRRGMLLNITLDSPLPDGSQPSLLSLGALSHFGFGLFSPVSD